VADGGGLENRFGVTPDQGSNPWPSASSTTKTATDQHGCRSVAVLASRLSVPLRPIRTQSGSLVVSDACRQPVIRALRSSCSRLRGDALRHP
jgi:hypothetical protein